MNRQPIYLVAGGSGVGKTAWICQQLAATEHKAAGAYACLGAGDIRIDETYVAAAIEGVEILPTLGDWSRITATKRLYVEIAPQIDLKTLELPFGEDLARPIEIVPQGTQASAQTSEWHDRPAEIIASKAAPVELVPTASPRWLLTGEVLDPGSLNLFWDELINGAYGTVIRAKAIFEIADGRSIYFNFGLGYPDCAYIELPLPQAIDGRPTRFSGLEIVGDGLQTTVITETLEDCGLDDTALAYYQAQIRSQLTPLEV
jgi:hypothetical protein